MSEKVFFIPEVLERQNTPYRQFNGYWYAQGTCIKRFNPEPFIIDFFIKPFDFANGGVNQVKDTLDCINAFYKEFVKYHHCAVPQDFTDALDYIFMKAGYNGKVVNSAFEYAESMIVFKVDYQSFFEYKKQITAI